MGSNMAEQHPVGFQWAMEAKRRGARLIHVDPRFTRTSAMADLHVRIRAGTDVAFLGAIVNYIFEHDAVFTEYVQHFTNGPVLINPEFEDVNAPDDSGAGQSGEAGCRAAGRPEGFFSGWNPDENAYDPAT
jgi:formate dehydrogenase major subunit